LPQAALAAGVIALLSLAVLNPDRFVAERNIDRYNETGRIDVSYLDSLSVDAVPALDRLPEPERSCALYRLDRQVRGESQWYEYNAARSRAKDLMAAHPVGSCERAGS
jgi:hypothetical protein